MTVGKKSSSKTVNESKGKILMEQYIYMYFLTSCKNVFLIHSEKSHDALAIYTKLKLPSQYTRTLVPLVTVLSEGYHHVSSSVTGNSDFTCSDWNLRWTQMRTFCTKA